MAKAKKSEEEQIVYDFLSKENRPFSVQNIVDALQKAGVKKTAVERSLASLIEKGSVTKKEYGKAKIFILAQHNITLPDAEEVIRLDAELADNCKELEETRARVVDMKARLSALRAELTLDQATEKLRGLEKQLQRKMKKRQALGDASTLITLEDKHKLQLAYYNTKTLWNKYKRVVKDITDTIGEATGQNANALHEEIGVETDQQAGISPADFPDIPNPAKRRKETLARSAKKRR